MRQGTPVGRPGHGLLVLQASSASTTIHRLLATWLTTSPWSWSVLCGTERPAGPKQASKRARRRALTCPRSVRDSSEFMPRGVRWYSSVSIDAALTAMLAGWLAGWRAGCLAGYCIIGRETGQGRKRGGGSGERACVRACVQGCEAIRNRTENSPCEACVSTSFDWIAAR